MADLWPRGLYGPPHTRIQNLSSHAPRNEVLLLLSYLLYTYTVLLLQTDGIHAEDKTKSGSQSQGKRIVKFPCRN